MARHRHVVSVRLNPVDVDAVKAGLVRAQQTVPHQTPGLAGNKTDAQFGRAAYCLRVVGT